MKAPYRGRNRYRTFLKAGEVISRNISRMDGVVGIVGGGAIGRQFGDRFSDLDLTVYAHSDHVKSLDKVVSIGWIEYKGVDFDIVVASYEKALGAKSPSKYWTQLRRWDQQNTQIMYDTGDRVKDLLKSKLVYPDSEQKKLLRKYHQETHEYIVFFPEMWAERGWLYNIVDSLMKGVQTIVLWIYARNKAFEPFMPKWPFFHFENNSIPESKYLKRLTRVYTDPIKTIRAAMRIREDLLELCGDIGMRWEVYSTEQAQERCRKNWRKVSEDTRKALTWK